MILIITHKEDYTSDYIINKLNEQNISYFRLNCEDIPNYNFEVDDSLKLSINGINSFKSVWFRRTKLADYSKLPIEYQHFLLNEYDSFLKNIFNIIDTKKWLSHPNDVYIAENKLLQLKFAKDIGFLIPKTLITTDKKRIKQFYRENNNKLIIKPFWNSKIHIEGKTKLLFTNLISNEHIDDLENLDISPIIFQECLEKKKEFRVTVIGYLPEQPHLS